MLSDIRAEIFALIPNLSTPEFAIQMDERSVPACRNGLLFLPVDVCTNTIILMMEQKSCHAWCLD
jgi:hypothetical protein